MLKMNESKASGIDNISAKFLKDGWYHIQHDHLWYFTPRICTELFERNGFQVVCIKPADKFSKFFVCTLEILIKRHVKFDQGLGFLMF